ncbi:MAG TPA: GxxExxY protein [Ramlibacter sp.]|nr:GxxExxY protein [Ramlibacter sp.]
MTQRAQSEDILDLDCSREIIGAAVEVQRVLGVGLLESAYAAALEIELSHADLNYRREVPVYGRYKSHDIGLLYRADFIVERSVSGHKLGLLINFHAFPVTKGIQRLVNNL